MYTYELEGMIDYWPGMYGFHEFVMVNKIKLRPQQYDLENLKEFLYKAFSSLAETTHWEIDIRELYIGGLPGIEDVSTELFLCVKQDNNGQIYIASPFPFAWLGMYCNSKNHLPLQKVEKILTLIHKLLRGDFVSEQSSPHT